jgi:hypothetical protein
VDNQDPAKIVFWHFMTARKGPVGGDPVEWPKQYAGLFRRFPTRCA